MNLKKIKISNFKKIGKEVTFVIKPGLNLIRSDIPVPQLQYDAHMLSRRAREAGPLHSAGIAGLYPLELLL